MVSIPPEIAPFWEVELPELSSLPQMFIDQHTPDPSPPSVSSSWYDFCPLSGTGLAYQMGHPELAKLLKYSPLHDKTIFSGNLVIISNYSSHDSFISFKRLNFNFKMLIKFDHFYV